MSPLSTRNVRTRIKICGITRPGDAIEAAMLGADAIGLVFHAPSPRAVDVDRAAAIVDALPPFVAAVALFVDPTPEAVRDLLDHVRVDLLQFHGAEKPELCRAFGLPYIKAIHVRAGVDPGAEAEHYGDAKALLFDAHDERLAGGTGRTFRWAALPRDLPLPVILAGGLNAENVAEAIGIVRPYGVDVSTGVESSPGIKDRAKMHAFVRSVRGADEL
jgi:phosphoribosylanthranilate isomerase